jgi:hypothetical protein
MVLILTKPLQLIATFDHEKPVVDNGKRLVGHGAMAFTFICEDNRLQQKLF